MEKFAYHRLYDDFKRADFILVGAGAGLSAAAGLSFADPADFQRRHPWLVRDHDLHTDYQTFSYRNWDEATRWGYFARQLHRLFVETPALPLYQTLKLLLKGRNYHIITSNVDRQFRKNAFPINRVFEYQGGFDVIMCADRCSKDRWPMKPYVERARRYLDPETGKVLAPGIPSCPHCGGPMTPVDQGWPNFQLQKQAYDRWLQASTGGLTLFLELGVGFNSAGIIRVPFERLVGERRQDQAALCRMTTDYPDDPEEIAYPEIPVPIQDKAYAIQADCGEILRRLARDLAREKGGPLWISS